MAIRRNVQKKSKTVKRSKKIKKKTGKPKLKVKKSKTNVGKRKIKSRKVTKRKIKVVTKKRVIKNKNKKKTNTRKKTKEIGKATKNKKKSSYHIKNIRKQRKIILQQDNVRKYLIHHAGEHAILIIQNLIEPATDEELAKKLKVRVSEVRSALNKLHAMRLTEYSRSKDKDTGWYTYKWNVRHSNVMEITKIIDNEIAEKLKVIPDIIYYCENCGDEAWPFDEAMDMQFKCPRCGSILTEANDKFKEKLKKLYL